MDTETMRALASAREAAKAQTLFYRALAANAEEIGDAELSERLNELHADEQHHLSRISARLLELGETLAELRVPTPIVPDLSDWEETARLREHTEVQRYTALLERSLDPTTDAIIRRILWIEQQHERTLAGKWTEA